jgi:hypothetical protein
MKVLTLGGRLVVLTTFRDVDVVMSPRDLVLRELSILGSRYASKAGTRRERGAGRGREDPSRGLAGGAAAGVEQVHRALQDGSLSAAARLSRVRRVASAKRTRRSYDARCNATRANESRRAISATDCSFPFHRNSATSIRSLKKSSTAKPFSLIGVQ